MSWDFNNSLVYYTTRLASANHLRIESIHYYYTKPITSPLPPVDTVLNRYKAIIAR